MPAIAEQASSELPHTVIRVALVGYGYWGPNLARCIAASDRARLAAICECAPNRAFAARAAYPGLPVSADVGVVLADPNIDAVVVATEVASHGPIARQALEHGKHVMVEKPLAGSLSEAVALADASAHRGLVTMVDHTYLFSPAFEAIRGVIAAGGLGLLRYYHADRSNSFGPSHPTSVLWDLAVHDVAILDALMDSAPSMVQAAGARVARGRRAAHAQVMLVYPDLAVASTLVSWVAPAKVRRVLLGFDRHSILWDDLADGSTVQLFAGGVDAGDPRAFRRRPHPAVENVPVPTGEPLAGAVDHFLDCVANGRTPRCDAATGVRVVRLIEAAERSLERYGSPASVDIGVRAA